MGKRSGLAFALLLSALAASPARSGELLNQIFAKCTDQKFDPDTRLLYCSGILDVSGLSDETRAAFLVSRAKAYEQKKDYPGADKDLNAAIALQANFLAYFERGRLREKERDLAGALRDFDMAVNLRPGDPLLMAEGCGARALLNQEIPKALADCNAAMALKPQEPDRYAAVLSARGLTLIRMERCPEAVADFDAAIAAYPQNATGFYGRGLCKRRAGDAAGGEADLAKAKANDPEAAALLEFEWPELTPKAAKQLGRVAIFPPANRPENQKYTSRNNHLCF